MIDCKLGIFLNCPHPEMIESVALSGFDFAVLDMEHSPLGPGDLYPLVVAAEVRKLQLVVRIPQKFDSYFKWCGDLNISCIQVPHVETADDVKFAIKNFFFAPLGERGLSRFVRAANFSITRKETYIAESNAKNRLILQIEGIRAMQNLEQILEVVPKEVSIFVGPYDLSQSLGVPGQIWDKKVIKAMEEIIEKCNNKQVSVGTFTDTLEGLGFWSKKGVNFLEYASDLDLFIKSANQVVSDFARILARPE